jgi:hypothetical protein
MSLKIANPQRSLLMNKIGDVLPREHWPSLRELLILEHMRGIRDAVASIRQFREKRGKGPNSLANLFYSVPRDLELFEEYLSKEGRIPKGRPGRPRKDKEADQILLLKVKGKSWAHIARKLKKSPDACRQLVRRRLSEMEAENKHLKAQIERREKELKERSAGSPYEIPATFLSMD